MLHQENAGPAAARNAGAAAARTPLLMVLDADDRLRPDAVRHLRPPLEEDPELAYTYGFIAHVGDWSGVIRFPDYDPFKLLYRPIVGTTWLMRRSAFEQVGGYDPECHVGGGLGHPASPARPRSAWPPRAGGRVRVQAPRCHEARKRPRCHTAASYRAMRKRHAAPLRASGNAGRTIRPGACRAG